jgi:hypothetical protein
MAQVSTGMGVAILGGCILGAAALTSHKFGSEAMAQGTGTEKRIVNTSIYSNQFGSSDVFHTTHYMYRMWSDNTVDIRALGVTYLNMRSGGAYVIEWHPITGTATSWRTVDNGTSAYLRADVDESRSVDAGDISAVLLDFGSATDNPPPPIDCTINAPR